MLSILKERDVCNKQTCKNQKAVLLGQGPGAGDLPSVHLPFVDRSPFLAEDFLSGHFLLVSFLQGVQSRLVQQVRQQTNNDQRDGSV